MTGINSEDDTDLPRLESTTDKKPMDIIDINEVEKGKIYYLFVGENINDYKGKVRIINIGKETIIYCELDPKSTKSLTFVNKNNDPKFYKITDTDKEAIITEKCEETEFPETENGGSLKKRSSKKNLKKSKKSTRSKKRKHKRRAKK